MWEACSARRPARVQQGTWDGKSQTLDRRSETASHIRRAQKKANIGNNDALPGSLLKAAMLSTARRGAVKKLGGRASRRAVALASPCPIRLGGSLALPVKLRAVKVCAFYLDFSCSSLSTSPNRFTSSP